MRITLTAERLWTGAETLPHPTVEIEGGQILSIGRRPSAEPPDPLAGRGFQPPASILSEMGARRVVIEGQENTHHFPGATLSPAFFDVHFHGAAGHDVMEATPEALAAIGAFLARHGTGSYLATTVTAPLDATLRALSGLAKLIDKPELLKGDKRRAHPVGIHLEGPFLSHARKGVQPAEHLLAPDLAVFDRLYEAGEGHVRMMTLAPELPGAVELAAHASARGVRVSMGHSDADTAAARAGAAAGAVSATHTFNAMRPLDHREPGILGIALTEDRLYAELICDGIHVAPEMVRLWWRAKGEQRAILVTDAMSATGMPDGQYQLGGFAVQVANGRAMARGVLAGSVLTQDRALRNFLEFTGAPVEKALRLLTTNPAQMTGLTAPLAAGQPADLVAVDAHGHLLAAMIGGRLDG